MNNRIIKFAIAPGSQLNSGLDLGGLLNFLTQNSFFEFALCKSRRSYYTLSNGKAEIGWLGPFSSTEAQKGGVEPLLLVCHKIRTFQITTLYLLQEVVLVL